MRFLGVVVILIASAVSLDASPAAACDCSRVSDEHAFARADAVFVGEAAARPSVPTRGGQGSSTDPAVWTFTVESVYKGEVTQPQGVVSVFSGASCGLELPVLDRVLVFARSEPYPLEEGLAGVPLYADLCGGSRVLDERAIPASFGNPSTPTAVVPAVIDEDTAVSAQASNDRNPLLYVAGGLLVLTLAVVAVVMIRRRRTSTL